jgi:hypothetical protein
VVQLKYINIVIVDGVEKEIKDLSTEQRERLVEEWNKRALAVIGYEQIKTA